jgi:MFS family permease
MVSETGGLGIEDSRGSESQTRLFTRPFVITCLATFFFYLSFYLILPVMPLYVAGMGGTSTQIGLIIGFFAFMAMILRPPAGWIIDTRGSCLVLVAGMAIFFLSSLGYVLSRSVRAVLALRLFHGMGMGLFPTAATVVVAELAPPARRGEAMGWFGIANSVGMVFGPAAGTSVAGRMGFPVLFLVAAGVALLGLLCVGMLPRVGKPSGKVTRPPRLQDFFSLAAVLPSAILLFLYIPYGAVVAFIPIIATQRGLANAGIFYTVFALAVLLVRAKAGRISDQRGRAAVILPGMLVASAAFATLGLTSGAAGVLVGAAIYGVGFGAIQPALLALTADRVPPEERGKAMGTFYTAWELGISTGAVASGLLLTVMHFPLMLLASATMPIAGALLTLRARSPAGPRPSA